MIKKFVVLTPWSLVALTVKNPWASVAMAVCGVFKFDNRISTTMLPGMVAPTIATCFFMVAPPEFLEARKCTWSDGARLITAFSGPFGVTGVMLYSNALA